jgi:uncharacterized protein (DUF1697 family)
VGSYVALLRGINVGGKNMIRMPALKECFEAGGFEDVTTYIQSGNVLFKATGSGSDLARRIEKILIKTFDHYQAWVVVRSRAQMRSVVEKAPKGFGEKPDAYLYDAIFLKEPPTASAVLKALPVNDDVDDVSAGRGVIYWSRVKNKATASRLNRVASLPVYKSMTIRNWNTTTRLLRMLDEA